MTAGTARWWAVRVVNLSVSYLLLLTPLAASKEVPLGGGDPQARLTERRWTTVDGMPVNPVHAVLPARSGLLWLATEEGLVRFDGSKFREYSSRSVTAFSDDNLQALAETADGTIWIGSRRGRLVRFANGEFYPVGSEEGLSARGVLTLFVGPSGTLWLGTSDGRVFRRVGTRFEEVASLGSKILALLEAGDGTLWLGTGSRGLFRRDASTGDMALVSGIPEGAITALAVAGPRKVAVAIEGKGVCTVTPDGKGCHHLLDAGGGLPSEAVTALLRDSAGQLWIGTYGGGLVMLAGGRLYRPPQPTTSSYVWSLAEGPPGVIWVGTTRGLGSLHRGVVASLGEGDGIAPGPVFSVCQALDGSVWLGGSNSTVTRYGRGGTKRILLVPTARARGQGFYVASLWPRPGGGVWAGTLGDGIFELDGNGRILRHISQGTLARDSIRSVALDANHTLWVGGRAGLARVRCTTTAGCAYEDALSGVPVTALALAADGTVYVGTRGRGLLALQPDGNSRPMDNGSGPASDAIHSLLLDRKGRLWIGTGGGGLSCLVEGRVYTWRARDGLWSDTIACLLEDDGGRLWASTNRGLFYLDQEAILANPSEKVETVPFGRADGMASEECNGLSQPAGWRMRDGTLWFATAEGVVVVRPQQLSSNHPPFTVVIEDAAVDGASMARGAEILLRPGWRRLTIGFTPISLTEKARLSCLYQLEGFERDWTAPSSGQSFASYTNLRPGNYLFRVQVSLRGMRHDRREAAMPVRVVPAFYQRSLFQAACLVTAVVATLALHRWRLRRLEVLNSVLRERNRLAQQLHDSVSQTMTGLTLQLQGAHEALQAAAYDVAQQSVARARSLAQQVLSETHEVLGGMRTRRYSSGDLLKTLQKALEPFSHRISCRVTVRRVDRATSLDDSIVSVLVDIGREAVANAVRHGGATEIALAITVEDDAVRLVCQDNGHELGARPHGPREQGGFGLWRIEETLQQLGGKWSISRTTEHGTTLEVVVPTPRPRRCLVARMGWFR